LQEPWEANISDEEWEAGASSDEETIAIEQNLPPPSYQDFEAALAGSGSSVRSKSKTKQEGSVSLNLKDIPKKPMTRPSLIQKPTARPGMQDAAQPPSPPPPLTLGTRPRPKDGFVEPTNVEKPPPRVDRNIEPASKKEAPPPPPLMAAPLKPQAPAAPVAPPVSEANPIAPVLAEKKQEEVQEVQENQPPSLKADAEEEVSAPAVPAPPTPRPQLRGKPPRTATAAPQSSRQPTEYDAAMALERAVRRERSVQAALDLQSSQGQITVKVWQVNTAGVLVNNKEKEIVGFIPLTGLSHARASAVLKEERRIRASIADNNISNSNSTSRPLDSAAADAVLAEGPALRRAALGILRDQEFLVEVVAVDKESGRVIFSEKAATQSMAQRSVVSPEGLVAAAKAMGSLVQCRVRSVRPFGIFVDFPLTLESGKEETAIGLVHSSEVFWDNARPASVSGQKAATQPVPSSPEESGIGKDQFLVGFSVGQTVTARLTHVDPKKARIFLSIRRATPNPLLETLDSLLASTGAGATMPGGTAAPTGPRQTIDAAVDMRPLLGDLEVAVKFAEDIVEVEGVVSANLGVRLESRASSPDVEVYMAKETGGEASLSNSEGGAIYKLVLRQGRDVQEVEIKCVRDRVAVRELAAATVAKIGAQPQ